MKFRPYQWEAVQSFWNYFESGKTGNPIIAMPTGTGKSLVIAGIIRSIFDKYPNQRIIVLTHVKELIEQNFEKLGIIWPLAPAGIYSSSLNRRDLYDNIIFAGIGSVVRRPEEFGHVDIILIDEAHLVSPKDTTMYRKFINALLSYNPNLKVCGLTATPYRLSHGPIIEDDGIFTDLCYDITGLDAFNKLVDDGYICPLIPKQTNLLLGVDGVHMRGNEFIDKELQIAVDKYELTEAAVRESIEAGGNRASWLTFTTGVEHALHTAEILQGFGIEAVAVHSGNKKYKMSPAERNKAIRQFRNGDLRCIVNNNILTTGFDHPEIDMIMNMRPTNSPGLWVQMLGRGTRPVYAPGHDLDTTEGRLQAIQESNKKNCLVMDFGANTRRLGPINDPILPKKKGKAQGGEAPVKLCEAINDDNKFCNTWVHASVRLCPECGNEFKFRSRLHQTASTDEIIKANLPQVEEFKIDHITYSDHIKQDRPLMMKVSYYSGLRVFSEYVCFEHEGFAQNKAKTWWRERTGLNFPNSTAEGIALCDQLTPVTSLRVWINKKYPEIMAHCFDGTHFGKEEKSTNTPSIGLDLPKKTVPSAHFNDLKNRIVIDDDLPF